MTTGDGDVRGQPRPLGPDRILRDLDQHFLSHLEQLFDSRRLAVLKPVIVPGATSLSLLASVPLPVLGTPLAPHIGFSGRCDRCRWTLVASQRSADRLHWPHLEFGSRTLGFNRHRGFQGRSMRQRHWRPIAARGHRRERLQPHPPKRPPPRATPRPRGTPPPPPPRRPSTPRTLG